MQKCLKTQVNVLNLYAINVMYGMQDDFFNKNHAILSKNEPLLSVKVYEKGLGLASLCTSSGVSVMGKVRVE